MTFLMPRTRLSDLNGLQTQLSRYFDGVLPRFEPADEALASGSWNPPVDISETTAKIVLSIEIPGVKQEDLDIRFEDRTLTLRGERKFEKLEGREYHRVERLYGTFVRTFALPRTVDAEAINATYRDGVLEIEMPKREEAKPKQIKIGVK